MTDAPRENILCRLFNCGVEWSSEQLKSACPPKKEKPKGPCTESKSEKIKEEIDIGPPCIEKRSCIWSDQICSKTKPCYIKMQDPYAPCCCETAKPEPSPCPPKNHRQQPRKLTCSCDLCKKKCTSSHKCCS